MAYYIRLPTNRFPINFSLGFSKKITDGKMPNFFIFYVKRVSTPFPIFGLGPGYGGINWPGRKREEGKPKGGLFGRRTVGADQNCRGQNSISVEVTA